MAIWTDEELEFRRRRYHQLHDEWVAAGMAEVAEVGRVERAALMLQVREKIEEFLAGVLDAVCHKIDVPADHIRELRGRGSGADVTFRSSGFAGVLPG